MCFGSLSFLLLAFAAVGAFFVGVVGIAFAYDLAGMKRFDPTNLSTAFHGS